MRARMRRKVGRKYSSLFEQLGLIFKSVKEFSFIVTIAQRKRPIQRYFDDIIVTNPDLLQCA